MKTPSVSRRQFLGTMAAVTAFTLVPRHVLARSGKPAPGDKLNLGCIGVGGMQGFHDVNNVSSESKNGRPPRRFPRH